MARANELARVGAALAGQRGAILVGDPGVGKSQLLRAALARASGEGAVVEQITASPGVSRVPFGAVLDWLGTDAPGPVGDGARVRAELARRLPARLQGRAVIGLHNAHLLDAASADLLHQVVSSGRALLLATAVAGHPVAAGISGLWVERLAERIDVMPFDLPQTALALERMLGAPAERGTAARLHAATSGNALLLRELTNQALTDGGLHRVDGRWQWNGPQAVGPRLADLVRARVGELDADERELLSMVALAGTLSADLPEEIGLAEAAESLNRRGTLRIDSTGSLRLEYPLYGQVWAATLPALTARRMRLALAQAVERAGATALTRPLATDLREAAGCSQPVADLLAAAETALRGGDFGRAERLARAVSARPEPAAGPDGAPPQAVRAALLLGRALAQQERAREADEVFASALACAPAPALRAELAEARALNLAQRLHRIDDADLTLAAAEAVLPDGGRHLQGARTLVWTMAGRLDDVAVSGRRALPDEPLDSLLTQTMVPAVAAAHTELGDAQGALALLEGCASALDRWEPKAWIDHRVVTVLSAFAMGRTVDAVTALDQLERRSRTQGLSAGLTQSALLRAQLHRQFGRLPQAVEVFRQAFDLQDGHDVHATRAWILARTAGCLAEAGRREAALKALAQAQTLHRSTPPFPFAVAGVALETVLVHAHLGDLTGALRGAGELAERCAAAGWVARELSALHLTARLGEARSVAARAARLAPRVSAGQLRLQAEHIAALAAGDGDGLEALAGRFHGLGLLPLAAESAAQAGGAYQAAGRPQRAAAARATCLALLSAYQGQLPVWAARQTPGPSAAHPDLTVREREVAVLAAYGHTNREIAARLVVSVRTVENHLQRAYAKLRVEGRSSLAGALA